MEQIADTVPPASSGHHIVEELLRVAKLTRAHVDIALRVADLKPGQDELINVLSAKPTTSVTQIAAALNVRMSTVSKMTDCLTRKGLVERVSDKIDHRKTGVVLTAAGVETQALAREIWCGVEENFFGDLSAAEKDEIRQGLELLDSRLRERLTRLR